VIRGRLELNPLAQGLDAEPNGTTATATLAPQSTVPTASLFQLGWSGAITSTTDTDYVNIGAMQVGDVISVTQTGSPSSRGSNTDTFLYLYRAGTTTAVATSDDDATGADSFINRFTVTTADTYYVRAHRFSSSNTGTYQVGVLLENSGTAPTTGGTFTAETEANETIATANNASGAWRSVGFTTTGTGTITSGDTDLYAYSFSVGDVVNFVTQSTSSLAPQSALLNSVGTVIALDDGTGISGGAGGSSPILGYVITTAGTYYHRVTGGSTTGSYIRNVGHSTTTPPTVAAPGEDYYAFTLAAGVPVSLALKNLSTGTLDVTILDGTNAVVAPARSVPAMLTK
jgi:hypothetical protein